MIKTIQTCQSYRSIANDDEKPLKVTAAIAEPPQPEAGPFRTILPQVKTNDNYHIMIIRLITILSFHGINVLQMCLLNEIVRLCVRSNF